ncbi:MAG: DNA repair protein RecN [Ottowia sp.]|nr:DNA repair protein RecN [Ottowia sp.]
MLRSLSIRNVVIVDALDLDFSSGFNVLSGETGAGKSILLDALNLTLGGRADASVVRTGSERADISAQFSLTPNTELQQWLTDNAFNNEEDQLILRRVIDKNGRSKAFINGVPATLLQLREAGNWLVTIHGQHAHQLLLKPGIQRQLLDRHAHLSTQVEQVRTHYEHWMQLANEIKEAQTHALTRQQTYEQLSWECAELDTLAPQTDEWAQLHIEHTKLAHAAKLIDGAEYALTTLADKEQALLSQLRSVIGQLQPLSDIDPDLHDVVQLLDSAHVQAHEAVHLLNRYTQHLELDPHRLAEVDTRLQALHSMARKYKITPEQLPEEQKQRHQQLAALSQQQNLEALLNAHTKAQEAYLHAAQALSTQRHHAAQQLASAVTTAMQTLAMEGGCFDIALTPLPQGGPYGLEQIEFLVAGHPGVATRPLAKVASGGELARISLALCVITNTAHPTPTLIFDEVDSGIGGTVAHIVGQQLRQLGHQHQVLCVTHLAQVAAQGHQHFCVSKYQKEGHTLSAIHLLNEDNRVNEIARMLGGNSHTARQHAQEMLLTKMPADIL